MCSLVEKYLCAFHDGKLNWTCNHRNKEIEPSRKQSSKINSCCLHFVCSCSCASSLKARFLKWWQTIEQAKRLAANRCGKIAYSKISTGKVIKDNLRIKTVSTKGKKNNI